MVVCLCLRVIASFLQFFVFCVQAGRIWARGMDTSLPPPDDVSLEGLQPLDLEYGVAPKGVIVLVAVAPAEGE
jgi:hypothetical protein